MGGAADKEEIMNDYRKIQELNPKTAEVPDVPDKVSSEEKSQYGFKTL